MRNSKDFIFVIENFIVLLLIHSVGGYFFAPILINTYPHIPEITLRLICSTAVSPVVAICYLAFRSGFIPRNIVNRETFSATVSGIIFVWLMYFVKLLIFGKYSVANPSTFYYLIKIFIIVIWAPLIEEILFRGYYYELLKSKGDVFAILVSSTMFVMAHAIFVGSGIDFYLLLELTLLFLHSIIYCVVYKRGGLASSVLTHVFTSAYATFVYFK